MRLKNIWGWGACQQSLEASGVCVQRQGGWKEQGRLVWPERSGAVRGQRAGGVSWRAMQGHRGCLSRRGAPWALSLKNDSPAALGRMTRRRQEQLQLIKAETSEFLGWQPAVAKEHVLEAHGLVSSSTSTELLHSVWQTLVHPHHYKCPRFIPFYGWVIFRGIHGPHHLYPLICWRTSPLLPCPDNCKQCCSERWGTCVFLSYGFFRVYAHITPVYGV